MSVSCSAAPAARALGDWGCSIVTFIAPLLRDPSANVRIATATAAEVVGEGTEPLLPDLIAMSRDSDDKARYRAAMAIAAIGVGADSAAPALRDPSFEVRESALRAFGRMGPAAEPAIDAIVATLKDPNIDVRRHAGFALSNLSMWPVQATSDQTVKKLISLLSDPDDATSVGAVEGLGVFGVQARPAIPALIRAFRNKTFTARRWAVSRRFLDT